MRPWSTAGVGLLLVAVGVLPDLPAERTEGVDVRAWGPPEATVDAWMLVIDLGPGGADDHAPAADHTVLLVQIRFGPAGGISVPVWLRERAPMDGRGGGWQPAGFLLPGRCVAEAPCSSARDASTLVVLRHHHGGPHQLRLDAVGTGADLGATTVRGFLFDGPPPREGLLELEGARSIDFGHAGGHWRDGVRDAALVVAGVGSLVDGLVAAVAGVPARGLLVLPAVRPCRRGRSGG